MFCIAAFIVFAVLGIFSASYRPLVKKAWYCVIRRVTFKPCDINFSEEVKGRLIGRYVVTHPRLARFLGRWIDWLAFLFVTLSIWSVLYVLNAGLNLWVYDTCKPSDVESCSLSGEACGIDQASMSFVDALRQGELAEWVAGPAMRLAETVSRVPDRLRRWEPRDFYGPTATTYLPEDTRKPFALEVIDPGCKFCRKLFTSIKQAGFERSHNLSYLLYPIPDTSADTGFKFPHSPLVASVIEATKLVPLNRNPSAVAPDWQVLEKIFGERPDGTDWQTYLNIGATEDDARRMLEGFLGEIGYTQEEVARIMQLAGSDEVRQSLATQKDIVENRLRTIKIPTILFGGRRYDRAVNAETLSAARK